MVVNLTFAVAVVVAAEATVGVEAAATVGVEVTAVFVAAVT